MTDKQIKVSISILTYNRADVLNELLTSLCKINYPGLELIVVDNHSQDGTQSLIKSSFPTVKYFRTNENKGVGARNIGMSYASGDIIITLDDDIIGLDESDIDALLILFKQKEDVGAICFKIVDYTSGEVCNWCHHYNQNVFCDREFVSDEITEGAVAFRKTALEKTGFYPSFFFISYEGADLLCRLLNNGYKTIYSPKICVRHRTHQSGRENWRRYYYDTRNQIWFVLRNLSFFFGMKYLVRGLTAMIVYSIRDGFFKYWLKGIFDGIRDTKKILQGREKIKKQTIKTLQKIAENRPSTIFMIKQRLLKKGIKL